jgi:hypothetical protein
MDAQAALQDLLKPAQCAPRRGDEVVITGQGPVLPTNYLLGTAGAAVIAAVGVAASDLWSLRGGSRQRVAVDMRAAVMNGWPIRRHAPWPNCHCSRSATSEIAQLSR